MDANNSQAKPRGGNWEGKGGCFHSPKEGKPEGGGDRESKPKKQFPGRKEVSLALGPRRALGKVCTGEESSHLHNSEKVGLWERAPGAPESAECAEGPRWPERRAAGRDRRRGPRCRLLFRPEVGARPAAFCAGSSRSPARAAAAEGQEQGLGASSRGRESAGAAAARGAGARPSRPNLGGGEETCKIKSVKN